MRSPIDMGKGMLIKQIYLEFSIVYHSFKCEITAFQTV